MRLHLTWRVTGFGFLLRLRPKTDEHQSMYGLSAVNWHRCGNGKNNKLDRAALICTVLPGPPNKCEISVGRIWEVLEPYNFILLIQTGAEVVVILTLHGLHCKLPGFVVLAGTAMGLHFSAAWWWEASNTPALSQARLGLEAMLSSVSDS